ncbi:MAG TPA: glycosyltransferase [Longimicrobiales bacterium]|nr:glycosyltransferase [Longimicrobiales bacterium]
MAVGWTLVATGGALVLYTYLVYPLLVRALSRRSRGAVGDPEQWPSISITVPVYNEARQIRETIESLLRIDYPADRRQILFVSDASSDDTDDIIREYADRGVELLRMPQRGGKTAGENAARTHMTGEIVVNTDASIRIHPAAVKALVRQFADPTVGVATGRDVSTGREAGDGNVGESGYVGYEMWVRDLETAAGGIVGASGSLYAIRRDLHQHVLPEGLSRDFASALVARERGFRAVSVPEATCIVPRTHSLRKEYRRKVRTMIRGIQTLYFKRHLLSPARHGRFAWMLFSHKVCRWAVPWALAWGGVGVAILSAELAPARLVLAAGLLVSLVGAFGWLWPDGRPMPRILAVPAFALGANLAAIVAVVRSLRGELNPIWEPTRRESERGGAALEINSNRIYH